ncbi:hypothetical protein Tco_0735205 [Tanacetum coccineum]
MKSASTPVDLEKPLVKDGDADDVDVHLYRFMIGSLMYLIASRLEVMFAVCACARFQVTPKTSHLLAVKRIFRYLKGKPTLGLWNLQIECGSLGNRLISWQCKKQTVVATSTTEAEYVAAASCCNKYSDSNQMAGLWVLVLEKAKFDQAIEIASLKNKVDKLEKRRKFRTTRLRRLKKVGAARRIDSSNYAGSDTRPPMLDRTDFDLGNNAFVCPERARVFTDLSAEEKERYKADIRATNILLQGIPKDIYTLINHYTDAKAYYGTMNNARGSVVAGNAGVRTRGCNVNPVIKHKPISATTINGLVHIARRMSLAKALPVFILLQDNELLYASPENLQYWMKNSSDQCDAFDSDVDEAPNIQTMFMVNLSSEDPIYDEAGPSYDSNTPFEVQDHDTFVDHMDEYHEVHEMQNDVQHNYVVDSDAEYASDSNIILYNQYMEDNEEHVVQSNVSSVRNDALMSIIDDMHEQGVQSMSANKQVKVVNDTFDDSELADIRNWRGETSLKSELHIVQMQLRSTVDHNKSMKEEVTTLKKDFKQKEDKYIEEFLDIKKLKEKKKVAIGYKNPLCLTRAKQVQSALYNGTEIVMTNHKPAVVHDSEETLEIAELTRKRMYEKMKKPLEFDKTCKKRITPTGLTEGERGFEQTKRCYLTEVIPFFKTLKQHFEGVQKALFKEVKGMEEIFDQISAEVDQNTMDKQCAEIERKNLLIANGNLIANLIVRIK